MKIDNNYSLQISKDCVNLKYESEYINEKGKTVKQKDNWYYPNVKMALKKYVNECVSYASNIDEIISKIEEVETKIDNLKLV